MFEEIEAKRNDLRRQGLDVGAPRGNAREAGFGGAVRDFAAGSIFWNPNTGAHFLSGRILDNYISLHGPGVDLQCFLRPLGFPVTDLTRDVGRKIESADFEWGSIHNVGGRFGFAIHQGLATSLPKLATPGFVGPTGFQIKLPPVSGVLLSASERPTAAIATIQSLWAKRIGLQRVDRPTEIVNLEVNVTVEKGGLAPSRPRLEQHATLPAGASLRDRTLYNVVLRSPRREVLNIAPHAFYCRSDWNQFGIIHVTDTHLGARQDRLQRKLVERSQREGINNYINFNDSFRHLVRYANKLHRKGRLDLILLTGDVVDYAFEPGDLREDRGGGGNFAVFERLVLGQEPSLTGVPSEELCVPLCATLGNHDYRDNRYTLVFKVGLPKIRHEVSAFAPMNLTKSEALHVQGSGSVPTHSRGTAKEEVHVAAPIYALRKLCAGPGAVEASFVLRLGPHRVVMLDSKNDIGIVDEILEWLGAQLFGSEDQKTFLGGSPNVAGVADHHLQLVRVALREAGDNGAVIVGIHGPCVNPAGNDFAHFLRETEHATASEADLMGWLRRRGALPSSTPGPGSLGPRPDAWFAAFGKPYFNRGANEQLLDSDGVSKGKLDEFLRLAAGGPGPGGERLRPVDVILSGHGHFRTELRVGWDEEIQGGLYFMDFYTENPVRYYATRKSSVDDGKERVHIYVSKRAGLNGAPIQRTDEFPAYLTLDVPPYATPLNDAADKRQWWKDHRPVFLETGALGPIESRSNTRRETAPVSQRPDISFSGFRFLTVAGSSIESIRYARLPELRQNALSTRWEPSTVITYDKNKGIGELYLAEANGRLRRIARHDNLRKSWTLIARGDFGGRGLVDAVFYDPSSNTGEFWEFSASGIRLLGQHKNWRSTWTHIVPMHVRMGGTSALLFHDQESRASEMYGTGEGGAMELLFQPALGVDKASHIVAVDVTGGLFSKVLTYDGKAGHAVMGAAVGNVIFKNLRRDWTHIVPGHFGGDGFTDLLFYQASTGTGEFYSINDTGGISLIRSHSDWRRGWTHIVAGNFGGGRQSDLLFYDASTRTAEISSVDSTGDIRRLDGLSNWGPWTHVVA